MACCELSSSLLDLSQSSEKGDEVGGAARSCCELSSSVSIEKGDEVGVGPITAAEAWQTSWMLAFVA